MWQPKLEARVLQELNSDKTDRVLEVGTGSGYFTALLAHRCAQVCSVEINPALAAFGRAQPRAPRRRTTRCSRSATRRAAGTAHARYDVIVLTGSTPVLPAALLAQLAPEGACSRWSASAGDGRAPRHLHRREQRASDLFETVIRPLVNAEQPSRFKF
jgi:protein-L-isoaspartate(D-aspartate) O-methyltransferase